MSKQLNLAQIAALMGELSVIFTKLEGSFRVSGGAGADADDDGEAQAKPAAKSRAKPAAKKAKPAAEDSAVDRDALTAALTELANTKGKDKVKEALDTVGAGKLSDVDEDDYGSLMETVGKLMEAEDEVDDDEPPAKPARKAKKKAGPSKEDVTAAFSALVESDKAAAKKVLKGLGVAKLSELEEDQYADAMEAIEAASAEDDDDDLVG